VRIHAPTTTVHYRCFSERRAQFVLIDLSFDVTPTLTKRFPLSFIFLLAFNAIAK
jgi:hypothetical protein